MEKSIRHPTLKVTSNAVGPHGAPEYARMCLEPPVAITQDGWSFAVLYLSRTATRLALPPRSLACIFGPGLPAYPPPPPPKVTVLRKYAPLLRTNASKLNMNLNENKQKPRTKSTWQLSHHLTYAYVQLNRSERTTHAKQGERTSR